MKIRKKRINQALRAIHREDKLLSRIAQRHDKNSTTVYAHDRAWN